MLETARSKTFWTALEQKPQGGSAANATCSAQMQESAKKREQSLPNTLRRGELAVFATARVLLMMMQDVKLFPRGDVDVAFRRHRSGIYNPDYGRSQADNESLQ